MAKRLILSLTIILISICFTTTALAAILVKDGSRGPAVRKVQTLLIDKGYLKDSADGVCGPKTVAAIKAFQKDVGLLDDGICGEETYHKLSGGKDYESEEIKDVPKGSRVLYMSATAYSPQDPGLSSRTATGTKLRYGVIAVDPTVIPLGTRVFIPGYGEATAEDTGGSIHGDHIDVAFDTHREALAFGRQYVEVYILDCP